MIRQEHYNITPLGGDRYRYESGGSISNCIPFEGDQSYYIDEKYLISEAEKIGNGIYQLKTGRYGYRVDLNKSIIRICPVRNSWNKYIEIFRLVPQPMQYRQINSKLLELFVDNANFRWSFFISDRGFKVNIRLKPGYSGSNVIKMGFRTNGLVRQGREIKNGESVVLRFKDLWLKDSSSEINPICRDVSETIEGEVLTLTGNLAGLTYPVDIDPTLGPDLPNMDGFISGAAPTTGYGQQVFNNSSPGEPLRILYLFDISAIPAGSTINSATFQHYYWTFGVADPGGLTVEMNRCTRADWEDAGIGTINAEANWTNYKDPSVPWTTAGGDYTTTDQVTTTVPVAVGNWEYYTPTALAQDALDNRSGLLSMLNKMQTEGGGPKQTAYYSLEQVVNVDKRPLLTVDYSSTGPYYYSLLNFNRRGRS